MQHCCVAAPSTYPATTVKCAYNIIPKQDSWVAKEEDVSCEKKESELLNVHEKMISERKATCNV